MKCGMLSLNRKKQNHTRPGDFRAGVVFSVYQRGISFEESVFARGALFFVQEKKWKDTQRDYILCFSPHSHMLILHACF